MLDQEERVRIWDRPTRLFHWALALAIVTSFVSVRMDEMELHFTSGGVVIFLIVFRVLWGIWGGTTARFLQFLPTPSRIREWRAGQGIGHSPWGALSVFAVLGAVGAQASLGLFTDDGIYLTGPLRDFVSSSTANWATKMHARMADVIMVLVALHLLAIAFYTFVKRNPLLKEFITGHSTEKPSGIAARPVWLFLLSAALAALPVWWVFA